jgi:hypothetical protein
MAARAAEHQERKPPHAGVMLLDPQRQVLRQDDDRHAGRGGLVALCIHGPAIAHRVAWSETRLLPGVAEKIPRSPVPGCMLGRLGLVV